MKLLSEFRAFAARGNVIDMAVGVVIGGAFGKIVGSFVDDILMPPLGLLTGRVDLSNQFIALDGGRYPSLAAAKAAGATTLNYGMFMNNIVSFLIIAFCIFLFVRQINTLKSFRSNPQSSDETPALIACPFCCTTIDAKAVRCPACTSDLASKA